MKYQKVIRLLSLFSLLFILFISACTDDNVDNLKAPTVTATSPVNNATNVARNSPVTITFNEVMDPSTINSSSIVIKQNTSEVPGVVTYDGNTATFIPTDNFSALTEYTVTVTTNAKTKAGKSFDANSITSFTTGGSINARVAIDLGTANNYVIVAKTAINNASTSAITGDLGLSPAATTYITGFALTNATGYATSSQVTGKLYAADMADPTPINLTTTVNNMVTAYNDAAARTSPDFIELGDGNIGGKTLTPGLYKWSGNVTIPSNVVLSGGANDVWIFQIAGTLTSSAATNITLIGGAQAKNIFWQVADEVTLGTTSHFEGTLLAMKGITLQTGASLNGKTLAQTAVILDSNTLVKK
jgi:hypothetical protein